MLPRHIEKLLVCGCLLAAAGGVVCPAQTQDTADVRIVDRAHAQDWTSDIVTGWRVHEGDDPAWASPGFDDSAWESVRLDNLGPARPGWRWYRLHVKLHENHPDLSLLIFGGDGAYALYVNGNQAAGPSVKPSLFVSRPTERVIALDAPGTDLVLALRTHAPPIYPQYHLPIFLNATLGTPDAIESQRQALESARFYSALPSIFINLLLIIAGVAVFALHRSQPNRREYVWLGLYLSMQGVAYMLWGLQISGILPVAANILIGEPLLYVFTLAQIEFIFSFGGQRVSRPWRVYECLLFFPVALILPIWLGRFPLNWIVVVEAVILLPVALLLPVLLLVWYRRGNAEAGWLILPSLLPAATVSLYDLGTLSLFFDWRRLQFLADPFQAGPIPLQLGDAGDFLFLCAIAVVIFFRFIRVSREQAHAAAELGAAREIQQRLVPASLPELAGFHLEAAYLPAQEVGGDFYQVLEQADGYALIVVGDVSGKGLKAAMTGALAIGALRTLAAENFCPGELLSRLNRQMLATQESGFITCLCLRMSSEGAVTLANAGHLSPYRGGEEIEVDSGLPLGLADDAEYGETHLELAPGDMLTLLSDGVVEAMNPQHQLLGFERVRAMSGQSAHDIAAAAQAFGQEDDITVLTLKKTVHA